MRPAGAVVAESVERRAGAKGNTHQQSTYWTQSQVRVSQALARIRQLVPSHTRGRSRMRESRTYGSVRGACDETHVPTATTARLHHAARRGGGVAARGARSRPSAYGGSDCLATQMKRRTALAIVLALIVFVGVWVFVYFVEMSNTTRAVVWLVACVVILASQWIVLSGSKHLGGYFAMWTLAFVLIAIGF